MSYKRLVVHRRVIVNLTTGTAFSGILWDQKGDLLVLRRAELLEAGVSPTPVDGEVLIERARVEYVQAIPDGGV